MVRITHMVVRIAQLVVREAKIVFLYEDNQSFLYNTSASPCSVNYVSCCISHSSSNTTSVSQTYDSSKDTAQTYI